MTHGTDDRSGTPGGSMLSRPPARAAQLAPLSPEGMPQGGAGMPPAPGVESRSILAIALRALTYRWTLILPALLLPVLVLPIVWLGVKPEYRANAVVRVSPVINRVVFKTDENGMVPLYASYLNTQVSMILSPTVLSRVVDKQRHPEIAGTKWFKDGGESLFGPPMDPVNRLQKGLRVAPRARTELIDVSFTAGDPREAQLIVNTVIGEYEVYHRDAAAESGQLTFTTLTKELNSLKRELDAELNLKAAVSKELGTTEPEELRAQLTMRLSELEADWKRLKREQQIMEWTLGQVQGGGKTSAEGEDGQTSAGDSTSDEDPEAVAAGAGGEKGDAIDGEEAMLQVALGADAEWRRLRDMLDLAEHQLNAAQARFGEAHPRLQQLTADVEFAKMRLAQRETSLRDALVTGASPMAPGVESGQGQAGVAFQNERAKMQASLLQRDIETQRQEVRRAGELAEELGRREEEIKRKRALYDSIQARIDELDVESKNPLGRVTTQQAIMPAEPSSDRRIMFSAIAVVLGIGLGAGLALLRAGLDKSLRLAEDVSASVTVPFLGELPYSASSDILEVTDESLLESLRMVRTALLERLRGNGFAVLITSPMPQAGKTTLTCLLGRSLAMLGKRVLLVDADLRRASLTERLAPNQEKGLTTILHRAARWDQVVVRADRVACDLICAGRTVTVQDPELLAGTLFAECVDKWKDKYDFVLLDSPPVLPVADARMLAGIVDGTLLTLRSAHSRRADASDTLQFLTASGARLLGTVLIGSKPRTGGYGYGYGYGYDQARQPAQLAEATAG